MLCDRIGATTILSAPHTLADGIASGRHLTMADAAAPRTPTGPRYLWLLMLLGALSLPVLYRSIVPKLAEEGIETSTMAAVDVAKNSSTRLPTYFLGIGGPNFIEERSHPAFLKLRETGREITTKVKPKAVVVFSAHWQHGPSMLAINVAEQTDLIYDFYGFPSHYYEYEYPSKGSPELAETVISKLSGAGIQVDRVKRGLDHGVWVGFAAGRFFFALRAFGRDSADRLTDILIQPLIPRRTR